MSESQSQQGDAIMMIEVTIPNWSKYCPRTDRTNFSWLRFQNNFFEKDEHFGISCNEVVIFTWMLCCASKINCETAKISVPKISAFLKISENQIIQHIQELVRRGIVSAVIAPPNGGKEPSGGGVSPSYDTIRYDTIRTNNSIGQVVENEPEPQISLLPVEQKARAVTTIKTNSQLISEIPRTTLGRWSQLYQDQEFLNRELLKALNFYESNPRKCPKTVRGWATALGSWFERGWTWRAKNIKGVAPGGVVDIDSILKGLPT